MSRLYQPLVTALVLELVTVLELVLVLVAPWRRKSAPAIV